jgi:hypothetical protein
MKNSASRAGEASRVDTTTNVVRLSVSVRVTARARSTKPSYIVWNSRKNSAMSCRNCEPSTRSATV